MMTFLLYILIGVGIWGGAESAEDPAAKVELKNPTWLLFLIGVLLWPGAIAYALGSIIEIQMQEVKRIKKARGDADI